MKESASAATPALSMFLVRTCAPLNPSSCTRPLKYGVFGFWLLKIHLA